MHVPRRSRSRVDVARVGVDTTPSPAAGRRGAAAGRPAGVRNRAVVSDREDQHHQARHHRHRGHGGPAALSHRHHGDQRDRLDPGRAARDRPDQRDGRPPRPQDQGHQGRRRVRLADLRREEQEAARQRPRRHRVRLLDLGLAQGGAAGVREGERPAVLPHVLRGAGTEQERDLHRAGGHAANHLGPRLGRQGEEGQELLPRRLRLHLAAHVDEDRAQAHREFSEGQGCRRGVLPAGPHQLQLADQQDQGRQARLHLRSGGGRQQCRVLQAAQGRGHHRRQAVSCSRCR